MRERNNYTGFEFRKLMDICPPENIEDKNLGLYTAENFRDEKKIARKKFLSYLGNKLFRAKKDYWIDGDDGFRVCSAVLMTGWQIDIITKNEYFTLSDYIENEKERVKK